MTLCRSYRAMLLTKVRYVSGTKRLFSQRTNRYNWLAFKHNKGHANYNKLRTCAPYIFRCISLPPRVQLFMLYTVSHLSQSHVLIPFLCCFCVDTTLVRSPEEHESYNVIWYVFNLLFATSGWRLCPLQSGLYTQDNHLTVTQRKLLMSILNIQAHQTKYL